MPRTRVDYADWNITVYRWCPYRCAYCYVWNNPVMRSRVLRGRYEWIDEAEKLEKMRKHLRVVVSFTSDPYPPAESMLEWTRSLLEYMAENTRHTVMVLTKNPALALRDTDIMLNHYPRVWLGTTLETISDDFHEMISIHAPPPSQRLHAMYVASRIGVPLWFSIEPLIPFRGEDAVTPEEIVTAILANISDHRLIRLVVLGKLNYPWLLIRNTSRWTIFERRLLTGEEAAKWYRRHVPEAVKILKKHGVPVHIKKELAQVLG